MDGSSECLTVEVARKREKEEQQTEVATTAAGTEEEVEVTNHPHHRTMEGAAAMETGLAEGVGEEGMPGDGGNL